MNTGGQGKGGEEETLNVVSDLSQPAPVTVVTRRQRWLILVAFVVMVASGALGLFLGDRRPKIPFGGFMAGDLVYDVETTDFGRFVRHEATVDGKLVAVVILVNGGGLTRCPLEDLDFVHRD